jgi:hypothetical protein
MVAWALMLWLLSAPGHVQQASTAHPELDEQAMAVLKWMAACRTQAPRYRVTVDARFDVVQDSGQHIAGGDTRQIVRRLDHVRMAWCWPCFRQSRSYYAVWGTEKPSRSMACPTITCWSVRRSAATRPGMARLTAPHRVERAQPPGTWAPGYLWSVCSLHSEGEQLWRSGDSFSAVSSW